MAVPRLIEFIESITRPDSIEGSDHLSEHGGGQVIVPVFPPGATAQVNITPPEGIYALISYRVSFGTSIVPNAFTGWFEHAGRFRYTGTLSGAVIRDGLEWYVVVTTSHPMRVSVTNASALAQYFEEVHQFCLVTTGDDYLFILNALRNLANTGQGEIQAQANAFLQQMAIGDGGRG